MTANPTNAALGLRERVARAVADRWGYSCDDDEGVIAADEPWMIAADAAIAAVLEALGEPTPAMLDAFVARALQVSIHSEGGWSEYGRNQWGTMLAAFKRENGLPCDS